MPVKAVIHWIYYRGYLLGERGEMQSARSAGKSQLDLYFLK